ncbi:hypothetical protein GQ457_17G014640 [Hibiscus cannabinus]
MLDTSKDWNFRFALPSYLQLKFLNQLNLNIFDPKTTEAISTLQALKFATDLGFHKIVLEGESLIVIKKLKSLVEDISILVVAIGETKARLGDFHYSYCSFVPRMANQASHAMANEGWNIAPPRDIKIT